MSEPQTSEAPAEQVIQFEGHDIVLRDGEPVWPGLPFSQWEDWQQRAYSRYFEHRLTQLGYTLEQNLQDAVDAEAAALVSKCIESDLRSSAFTDLGDSSPIGQKLDLAIHQTLSELRQRGIERPLAPLAWALGEIWERSGPVFDLAIATVACRAAESLTMVAAYNAEQRKDEKANMRQRLASRGLIRAKSH